MSASDRTRYLSVVATVGPVGAEWAGVDDIADSDQWSHWVVSEEVAGEYGGWRCGRVWDRCLVTKTSVNLIKTTLV